MESLKLILNVLKFGALAIGSISGLVGTLTETKDKGTGIITPWGKLIFTLIALSGVVAIASQSIEIYLKRKSDISDAEDRAKAASKTSTILDKANQAASGIETTRIRQEKLLQDLQKNVEMTDNLRVKAEELGVELKNQRESIGKTVTGIQQTARDLSSVLSAQTQTLDRMFRLTHPLGNVRVEINVSYPIRHGIIEPDSTWLARIRSTSKKQWILLNDPNDPMNPKAYVERYEFRTLKQPEFDLTFNRKPTQVGGDRKHVVDHDAELLLRTADAQTLLYIHLDEMRIDQQVTANTVRVVDSQDIGSWSDLYGAELIIQLGTLGSRITGFNLIFGEATLGSKKVFIHLDDSNLREESGAYVKILSEKELGPKPDLLKR